MKIDEYVRCRTYRHAWFEVPSSFKVEFGTPLQLMCQRCTTVRVDIISRATGDLIGRRYIYPKGYQYAAGTVPSMPEFRQQLIATINREKRAQRKING